MPTLKQTLKQMLSDARASGKPTRRMLARGLVVEVAQVGTGDVVLALERTGIQASPVEFQTVLKHWPEPLPPETPVPVTRKEGRVFRSITRWARPMQPLL